jgi:predicted DNA-binding transcriptional regulator YafY
MKPVRSTETAKMVMIQAMRSRTQVVITYTRSNGSITVRAIEPFGFCHNGTGDLYVRSMDVKSGQTRAWRLDRIIGWERTDQPFTLDIPGHAEPEQWTRADRVSAGAA